VTVDAKQRGVGRHGRIRNVGEPGLWVNVHVILSAAKDLLLTNNRSFVADAPQDDS